MASDTSKKIEARVFSRTFEQMCNFLAVVKTGNPRATVQGLIKLCLLEFQDEHYKTAEPFRENIETLFGLVISFELIHEALDELERNRLIYRVADGSYRLDSETSAPLRQRVQQAKDMESRVKANWFQQLEAAYPKLHPDLAWKILKTYLLRTFRRHGIQATELLNPLNDKPQYIDVSLSAILRDAIHENLANEHHNDAARAVSDFLAFVDRDDDRARYIAQLADGAFNFYTLEVPSDLAERFREQLTELTIFLDTNFLFGILDLHYSTQVQVSHDLLRAIDTYKLPFKLRYHEATAKEMRNTITFYGSILRSRRWTRSLSGAASQSRNLSGIEQKFHERNALHPIDVDEFLRPYEHFDQLLDEKGIKIFRPHEERQQDRIDLYHKYQDFLILHHRGEKVYETVMHDATVLEEAYHLRSNSASSLEAGTLIITCDYYLYRFDWSLARNNGHRAVVLLPNIFWQILRPYIPSDHDFEKAFAETFALPEFRAIGSGGGKACTKMLQILATYKDVPEQTAFKLLSNDLLLDGLRVASEEIQFTSLVEAAFVEENKNLMEEKIALELQLKEAQRQHETEAKNRGHDLEKYNREQKELQEALVSVRRELETVRGAIEEHRRAAEAAMQKTQEAEQSASAALVKADQTGQQVEDARRHVFWMNVTAGISIALVVIVLFELVVHQLPWPWLRDHPNGLPLQIGACTGFLLLSLGGFVKPWRGKLWGGSGLVGLFFMVLALLGNG